MAERSSKDWVTYGSHKSRGTVNNSARPGLGDGAWTHMPFFLWLASDEGLPPHFVCESKSYPTFLVKWSILSHVLSPALRFCYRGKHYFQICFISRKYIILIHAKRWVLIETKARDQWWFSSAEFWVLLPWMYQTAEHALAVCFTFTYFSYSVGVLLPTPKGIGRAIMLYKKKNVSLATGLGRGKLSATALVLVTSICTIL